MYAAIIMRCSVRVVTKDDWPTKSWLIEPSIAKDKRDDTTHYILQKKSRIDGQESEGGHWIKSQSVFQFLDLSQT